MKKTNLARNVSYKLAKIKDIPRLNQIEEACFNLDRLNTRSFRWIIKNGNADLICLLLKGEIVGYALLFYHRGTTLARLYSFALHPAFQGKGLSNLLMEQIEVFAEEAGKSAIRLEVRTDNIPAIKLYEKFGYKKFKVKNDYYEDHTPAICYEKKILKPTKIFKFKVPYYMQTTEFTCGPASLIMAMATLDKTTELSQRHELEIWREATTIFMLAGHGGCGPRGLALAAHKRGFKAELYLSRKSVLFADSVRTEEKKKILQVVHEDYIEKINKTNIKTHYTQISLKVIEQKMKEGGIPLILISSYKITKNKAPHWVVISGIDKNFIYLHNPEVDDDVAMATNYDGIYIPVPRKEFLDMAKYGTKKLESMVIIGRKLKRK